MILKSQRKRQRHPGCTGKISRLSEKRRHSSELPPWPEVNIDLVCVHGFLARAGAMRAKRRSIGAAHWRIIESFFPESRRHAFPTAQEDCAICLAEAVAFREAKEHSIQEAKAAREEEWQLNSDATIAGTAFNKAVLRTSESLCVDDDSNSYAGAKYKSIPPVSSPCTKCATAISKAKAGESRPQNLEQLTKEEEAAMIPSHLRSSSSSSAGAKGMLSHGCCTVPSTGELLRGLLQRRSLGYPPQAHRGREAIAATGIRIPLCQGVYFLLPHFWLRAWRHYLRDHQAPRPPPPDASALLCDGHMLPLIPPHIRNFLHGQGPHREAPQGSAGGQPWGPLHGLSDEDRVAQTICEILTEAEYVALVSAHRRSSCNSGAAMPCYDGFSVAFSVSVDVTGISVQWRTQPCQSCDAFHEHLLGGIVTVKGSRHAHRRRRSSSENSGDWNSGNSGGNGGGNGNHSGGGRQSPSLSDHSGGRKSPGPTRLVF